MVVFSKDSNIVNEVIRRFQIFFIKKLHNHKTHLTKKSTSANEKDNIFMYLVTQTKEKQHFYIYSKTSQKKIHKQNKKKTAFYDLKRLRRKSLACFLYSLKGFLCI